MLNTNLKSSTICLLAASIAIQSAEMNSHLPLAQAIHQVF